MKYGIIFFAIFCILSVSSFGFSSWRIQQKPKQRNESVSQLIKKVQTLTDLPDGEPFVATVKNARLLQHEKEFKAAQNGDKLIIYLEVKKAYLYRPTTNKLIDILPLTSTQSAFSTSSSSAIEAN